MSRVPMTEQEEHAASKEGGVFRSVVGFMVLGGSLAGFAALFLRDIPTHNENSILFALGIVFGWGSAVVQSEYGASTTGRKVAEQALKKLNEPVQEVNVTNKADEPVPTTLAKGAKP